MAFSKWSKMWHICVEITCDMNWSHNQSHQPSILTIYFERTNLNCSFYLNRTEMKTKALAYRCCGVKLKCEAEASNRMPKAAITGPIFHEKSNGNEASKKTPTVAERKKLPSQMFREMNMENTALRNIWQGYGSLWEKCCRVIIPSLWPLPEILPGRAWAHLTSSPQCNTGSGSFNG